MTNRGYPSGYPLFYFMEVLQMDLRKMIKTGEGIDQLEQNLLGLDAEFRFSLLRKVLYQSGYDHL